jgi:RHS repeat-associated protein
VNSWELGRKRGIRRIRGHSGFSLSFSPLIDHQTRFAYDGSQMTLQFDKEGGGNVTVNDLSHRYLWQPGAVDKLMADEQLTMTDHGYDRTHAGRVVWPLADHQGTIRDLAVRDAQTGVTAVANHRVYDAYGNLKSQTNAAVDCLFGFTGRPLDKHTGLQNNWNRWYDSKIGGWVSHDSIGFNSGTTNLDVYCGNLPVMHVDPAGLAWCNPFSPGSWWNPINWVANTGEALGTGTYKVYSLFDTTSSQLDQQLAEVKQRQAERDGTLAENFRNIQLVGAKNTEQDAETLANLSVQVTAMGLGGAFVRPTMTSWGWSGSNSWREAVNTVSCGGEVRAIAGKVATYEEAVKLIEEAGGTIQRVEEAHLPSSVAASIDYKHINYTLPNGSKAHIEIQNLPK